jgi:hypothetical protein
MGGSVSAEQRLTSRNPCPICGGGNAARYQGWEGVIVAVDAAVLRHRLEKRPIRELKRTMGTVWVLPGSSVDVFELAEFEP